MKILLVLELYDGASNGNTISAHHLADNLRARGHEVRIAASGETYDGKWGFGVYHVPVFDKLISAHGFMFGIPDEKKMEEAVHWADIVHVMMPFPLGKLATRIAVRDGIPCTGAFHIQPENIWSSVGLGNFMPLINFTYWFANRYIFRYFHYIHCPSRMISNMLKSHGYKAEMRIISNGISLTEFTYHKCPKRKEFQDRFVVVMSGRLSREKRQDILINAVKKSKYADRIQLYLAGQGPKREEYEKLAEGLPNPIMMQFLSTKDLIELLGEADLYVHASDIDIEAMSCMEAFASGLVPIISDSARSAASQFALDERSVFKAGDSTDLAAKIDWWIEHPEERKRMEPLYSESAVNYSLDKSVDMMIGMFEDEIKRCGKEVPLK